MTKKTTSHAPVIDMSSGRIEVMDGYVQAYIVGMMAIRGTEKLETTLDEAFDFGLMAMNKRERYFARGRAFKWTARVTPPAKKEAP